MTRHAFITNTNNIEMPWAIICQDVRTFTTCVICLAKGCTIADAEREAKREGARYISFKRDMPIPSGWR